MSLQIINGGIYTTIQDAGRYGFQKYGVIVSGAMDLVSFRIANILVNNDECDAAIEITMMGTEILFEEDYIIAITGGNLKPELDGATLPMWRPVFIKKGQTLKFKGTISGCRAYLAINGGIDVPTVMKSKSTYIRAEIGGFKGRTLKKGDKLHSKYTQKKNFEYKKLKETYICTPKWHVSQQAFVNYGSITTIRLLKGAQYDSFDENSKRSIQSNLYTITTSADRMGYRLDGIPLINTTKMEQLSECVTFGTIQVPSNGMPIILMADRQTSGGYPKLGQVITADLPKLAQMKPGEKIQFQLVTIKEAEALLFDLESRIKELKLGLRLEGIRTGII